MLLKITQMVILTSKECVLASLRASELFVKTATFPYILIDFDKKQFLVLFGIDPNSWFESAQRRNSVKKTFGVVLGRLGRF